jgi:hypothetical protein
MGFSRREQFNIISRNSSVVPATGTGLLRPSTCPSVVRVDGAFRTPASLEGAGVRLALFPGNSVVFCYTCACVVSDQCSLAPVSALCGTVTPRDLPSRVTLIFESYFINIINI